MTTEKNRMLWIFGCMGFLVSFALGPQEQPIPPEGKSQEAQESQEPSPQAPPEGKKIAIVPIHRQIDDVSAESLRRRSEQAIDEGATILVYELDTPGGMVSSAADICKYIRNLSENRGIRTVAWVRDEAISGGTMIAMACDEIIMSRTSVIGDCGVIMVGMGGASTAQDPALDAKIESYVLHVFDSAASRVGYDPLLCESFVRHEIEVWWLEHKETGERRFADAETKRKLLGETEQENGGWARLLDSKSEPEWKLVESYVDPRDGEEKPLRQPVVPDNKLLTIDQSMASVLGFCKKIVKDEEALKSYYGTSETTALMAGRYERTWSENLVSWLTSPGVRMLLIALITIGAYTEFNSPGLGLPGLVSVTALIVFLGAPYLTGLANVWEIVFVILGLILIMVEVFVIPGFGVAGISGLVLLIVGLLATFMPEEPGKLPIYWPELPQSFEGLKTGIVTLAAGLAISFAGMILISRYLPNMPYFRSVIPANPTTVDIMVKDPYDGLARVGDIGISESPLRPAGKARFGSMLVDVVTEGDLIEPQTRIEVIERRGNRVVVRRMKEA